MSDTSFMNVNGNEFTFTDAEKSLVKIYNLSPLQIRAYDIYFLSQSYDSYVWLMTKVPASNGALSCKISITLDASIDGLFSGTSFNVAGGMPGEAFSNPIIYKRNGIPGKATMLTPTYNKTVQQQSFQLFTGSSKSNYKSNWLRGINGDVRSHLDGYSPSLEQGSLSNSLNTGLLGSADLTKQVGSVYLTILNRYPGQSELTMWTGLLDASHTITDLVKALFSSAEYGNTALSRTDNEAFISALYIASLNRSPSDAELSYFVDLLDAGRITRREIVEACVNSLEYSDNWELASITSDDYLTLQINKLDTVSKEELSNCLKDVIIVVQPSERVEFSDIYLYGDENAVTEREVGITYKY